MTGQRRVSFLVGDFFGGFRARGSLATPAAASGLFSEIGKTGGPGIARLLFMRGPRTARPAISVRVRSVALRPFAGMSPGSRAGACVLAPAHPARSRRGGTSGRGLPGSGLRGRNGGAGRPPRDDVSRRVPERRRRGNYGDGAEGWG